MGREVMSGNIVKFPEPDTITQHEADVLRQGGTPEAAFFQAQTMLRAAYTTLLAHWTPENARQHLCNQAAICGTLRGDERVSFSFIEKGTEIDGEAQP